MGEPRYPDALIDGNRYEWWPVSEVDGGTWVISGEWSVRPRLGLVIDSVRLWSTVEAPINSAALRLLRIDQLRAAVNRATSPTPRVP